MKREMLTVLVSLILVVIMSVLANIDVLVPQQYVWGRIRIPARGIYAEVYTTERGDNCIPTLWNGGKVTVKADLSTVQLYDMAELTGLDGEHYVLECVEIMNCLAIGQTLLTTWGRVVHADGDVLLCTDQARGRVHVFRLIRL